MSLLIAICLIAIILLAVECRCNGKRYCFLVNLYCIHYLFLAKKGSWSSIIVWIFGFVMALTAIIIYIVLGFQGGIQAGKLKDISKAIDFFFWAIIIDQCDLDYRFERERLIHSAFGFFVATVVAVFVSLILFVISHNCKLPLNS